jgi:hypothetical protein
MKKLPFNTPITGIDNITLGDFWTWAYSDVIGNRNRSIFAEFLVGTALGVVDQPRVEWDAVDLRYSDSKVEVKAAGYVQSWHQESKPSKIVFDIAHKRGWDAATNTYSVDLVRSADCYVFCLHSCIDLSTANPLNVEQWEFFVLSTLALETHFGQQKQVALSRLKNLIPAVPYYELKSAIDECLSRKVT